MLLIAFKDSLVLTVVIFLMYGISEIKKGFIFIYFYTQSCFVLKQGNLIGRFDIFSNSTFIYLFHLSLLIIKGIFQYIEKV